MITEYWYPADSTPDDGYWNNSDSGTTNFHLYIDDIQGSPDDDTSCIWCVSAAVLKKVTHNTDNSTKQIPAGATDIKLTLNWRGDINGSDELTDAKYTAGILSGATQDTGDIITGPAGEWYSQSKEYTTDPATSAAWTVANANAVKLLSFSGSRAQQLARLTQVYLKVEYNEAVSSRPEKTRQVIDLSRYLKKIRD